MKLKTDAVIAGGGLAGLGLAYQLKSASPELDVVVLDKRKFPVPRAITKVGESTVEIGSHYLSKHLKLADHLKHEHLKKFGIRIFFGEGADDFSQQDELGASQTFGIPTYQIDRGDIENHLACELKGMGVQLIDNADIQHLSINQDALKDSHKEDKKHHLQAQTDTDRYDIDARWLLDASGRRAFIKQQLNLHKNNQHQANAIWFRIDKTIEIDQWSEQESWHKRCMPRGKRWLSTNHLVGPGYWVWIIPLASGITSIGIVMDNQAFDESQIECEQSAMSWLHKNQSRCAEAIGEANFLDFVVLKDYSYSCKQLFSDNGWGITGEAGLFADPLYSPGSDFIAINNGFIDDLVRSDAKGEDIRFKRALYERLHFSIYNNTLSLYTGQYGGFGDRQMMGLKLLWDYSYYWGVLSLLFFQNVLTDIARMRKLSVVLQKAQTLNQQVQSHFRQRAEKRLILPNRGVFMDQYKIPCLKHFNEILMMPETSDINKHLQDNVAMIEQISVSVMNMLSENPSRHIDDEEHNLLGDYRQSILA